MADDVQGNAQVLADEESPGARLRRARKGKKLTTRQVARKLHMDSWMLDAIERDEFSALGAPVFAKGHLRKYATELGVEPDDLMVAYYQLAGTRETPPLIAESILRMESANGPTFGWLLPAAIVFAAVASVAAGAMWFLRSDAAPRPASAAAALQPTAPPEDTQNLERSTSLSLPLASAASPAPELAVAEDSAAPADESGEEPGEESATRIAALDAQPVSETPAAATLDSVTLTLRFRDQSWVEVYDRDRNKLLYGMGEADSVQYLSGPAPLQVFLGRYRDVDVELNGNPYSIPPEARRTNTARFRIEVPNSP